MLALKIWSGIWYTRGPSNKTWSKIVKPLKGSATEITFEEISDFDLTSVVDNVLDTSIRLS